MGKPISMEEVQKRLSILNIKLHGSYINVNVKTSFICHCGNIFSTTPNSLFTGGSHSCGCIARKRTSEVKLKNLCGEVFSKLTAIKLLPKIKKYREYLCRCECGNEIIVIGDNLVRGNTKSCGCNTKLNPSKKLINLTGQKFGRWNVLEILPKDGNMRKYKCECCCGNIKILNGGSLTSGRSISCGCYAIELLKLRTGINNPLYNPNLTDEDRIDRRNLPEYRSWSRRIKKRDNWVCQICQTKRGPFNAHHLDAWNWNIERRFDLTNGATLCKKCHKNFHSEYGNKCTEQQFDEYIRLNIW